MKSGWHQGLGFGALGVALLVSCGKPAPPPPLAGGQSAPRAVQTAPVERRPMERALHVVGTLLAQDEATVAAQVAGQLEAVRVDLGDRVTAGQVVALIDTASYEALARQAAANVAKAAASATSAARNLKRIQELQADKIASTSELDQAVAEAEQTRAEVKAAEAADAVAQLNLERSRVKAPFAGAIARRVASVGDYVAVGAPIVTLVKTDPLRLRLEVPERDALRAGLGQRVELSVEGDTNTWTGRITRLSPALAPANRMLWVEADVPAQGVLRPGLFARARIIVNEREEGLSVPASALVTFAGLEKVVVVADGKAREKSVTTGRRGADWVEIVSGVAAGEAVVVAPGGLRSGQAVIVGGAAAGGAATNAAGESSK